jgi:vacuolar-type H+-ATPase subunit E/Vma4
MDEAEARRREIMQKTDEYHTAELDRYKSDTEADSELRLRNEQGKMAVELSRRLAVQRREFKNRLYAEREKYRQTVFEKAREGLLAFARQPEYGAFLRKKAEKASVLAEGAKLHILLGPRDMVWKDVLEKACPCTVGVEENIKLGGFLAENGAGMLIDETLDSALEGQKDWFYGSSGFGV